MQHCSGLVFSNLHNNKVTCKPLFKYLSKRVNITVSNDYRTTEDRDK